MTRSFSDKGACLANVRDVIRRDIHDELQLLDAAARRFFVDFVRAVEPEDYEMGWVHEEICAKLQVFLKQVVNKESPRLMIFAPPRHGKSQLASRDFPAFALGEYPDLSIIATSYAADLASSNNRDVQRIIDSDVYRHLFPMTRLNSENIRTVADGSFLRNSDVFEIVGQRGIYKSSGVGGGITGRGMHLGIIDDPIKDAEQAYSQTYRDKVWDWYRSTFYTRLMPGGGILIILTRWHDDDLAGRILASAKESGEKWDIVEYPAIAEKDEKHRKIGEALHPSRYNLKQLALIKQAVGSRVWDALYQQHPNIAGGNIFKRENWQYLRAPRLVSTMSAEDRKHYFRELGITQVIQRWDTALGNEKKKKGDYTACVTFGIAKSRYYVIDVWKEQLEFPDVVKKIPTLYARWIPNKVIVEGGGSASGKAAVQTLKRETRVPIFEVSTSTDKVFRAQMVSPSHESGLCTLFSGEQWVSDFEDQCANFPGIKNDDDVDAFIGAMEEATSGVQPMQISDDFLHMVGAR